MDQTVYIGLRGERNERQVEGNSNLAVGLAEFRALQLGMEPDGVAEHGMQIRKDGSIMREGQFKRAVRSIETG